MAPGPLAAQVQKSVATQQQDSFQKLHDDLSYWANNRLISRNTHPDLRDWKKLVLEIASKPFIDFTYDQLERLHSYTGVFKALADENKTILDAVTAAEYRAFTDRIENAFNVHPGNEAYRLIRDFYIRNHDHIVNAEAFLFSRSEYKNINHYQKKAHEFLEAIESLDPRFAPNAPITQEFLELAEFTPDTKKLFEALSDNSSPLRNNIVENLRLVFKKYYELEGDPIPRTFGHGPHAHEYTPPSANDLYKAFNDMERDWTGVYNRLIALRPSRGKTP